MDDSVDLSIILLMASVHNKMVSRTQEAADSSTKAYFASKVNTLRAVHKKLAHKWGVAEAVVSAFIVGGLIGAEVSDRLVYLDSSAHRDLTSGAHPWLRSRTGTSKRPRHTPRGFWPCKSARTALKYHQRSGDG